jgi:hypothetical protein
MTNQGRGPWKPGRGKTLEAAAEQAWENAKKGAAEQGFTAASAPPGTYKLEIWVETKNPIHSYIVGLIPTGP